MTFCLIFSLMPLAGAAENQNLVDNNLKTNLNSLIINNTATNQSLFGISEEEIAKLQEWLKKRKMNASSELKTGATGDEVKELQKWLKENNFYSGEIDGTFGIDTENAVKEFQKAVGLKDDGSVGIYTLRAMQEWDEYAKMITSGSADNVQFAGSSNKDITNSATSSTSNRKSYSSRGTGDCWDNSAYLYGKLTSSGTKARVIQYGTSLSSRHRSVQVYSNGRWVDYNYKANGYAKRYYATSSKPGMTVIK